jgi:hypothetical protein
MSAARFFPVMKATTAFIASPDRFTSGGTVMPFRQYVSKDRARIAHKASKPSYENEGEPPLTRALNAKSSGGETRTLNLAINSRLLCR